jgi:hypothetical protein
MTFAGSRLNSPDQCPSHAPRPCHFYFVFGQKVSSQINVIFQSSIKYSSPTVWYSTDQTNNTKIDADSRFFTLISWITSRYVYYGYLDNLDPDTTYYVKVGDASNSASESAVRKVKTGPIDNQPFTFAVGGDVGCEWPYPTLSSQQVAKREVLFLALGGDIAYANGLPGCYQRWDTLLWMFEESLITPSGYTIPFVTCIGNHEAGVPWGSYDKKTAPYYFTYLPSEPFNGRNPEDLSSYRYHLIGNETVLYALDSEITLTSESQVNWLSDLMGNTHAHLPNKLALYHVPLFPGSRSITTLPIGHLRDIWLPLFEVSVKNCI